MLRTDSTPLRVLIIDDQADRATRLSSWLRTLSCKTSVGFDARAGLRLSELFRPSLVFIGLGLPDHAAFGLLKELKRILEPRGAIFVALNDDSGAHDEPLCWQAGFNWVAAPTIEPAVLHEMLNAAMLYRDEAAERSWTGRRLSVRA